MFFVCTDDMLSMQYFFPELKQKHDTEIKMSNSHQRWLESSDTWEHNLGKGWKGKNILGRSSYDIARLWEYEGGGLEETALAIKQIVVKQTPLSTYDRGEDRYIKGIVLRLLTSAESRHII